MPKLAPVFTVLGTMDSRRTPPGPQTTLACTANSYTCFVLPLFCLGTTGHLHQKEPHLSSHSYRSEHMRAS